MQIGEDEKEDYLKKVIKDTFSRELYVKRIKADIEGRSESEFYLTWGPRAHLEFDKKKVLEYVCKIMKKSPISFMAQYSQVYGTDPNEGIATLDD